MLEQSCKHSKQCRNNVATLCCATNHRCESARVTSTSAQYEGTGGERRINKRGAKCRKNIAKHLKLVGKQKCSTDYLIIVLNAVRFTAKSEKLRLVLVFIV